MWIIFGLGSAIFNALSNINTKKNVGQIDVLVTAWLWIVCAIPIVFIPVLIKGFAETDKIFWIALFFRTILDSISTVLYVKALKNSDITLAQPLLALTPVLIIPISYFLYGDIPSILSGIGVLVVTSGIYLNNWTRKDSFLAPFRKIHKNKGSLIMLFVAIMYAITSSLHTLAIRHSDPFTYAAIGFLAIGMTLSVVVFFFRRKEVVFAFKTLPPIQLFKTGFFDGMAFISQMIGQGLTQASYLIAVKRTSIIFSALLAKKFLGEDIKNRILPIIVIVTGVIIIVLGNKQ